MTIDELKRLEKAATPAPWDAFVMAVPEDQATQPRTFAAAYVEDCIAVGGADFHIVGATLHDGRADVCHPGNGPKSPANAALIAAARNALPALLAVAEAAKLYHAANVAAGVWNDLRQAESVEASECGERLAEALAALEAQS